MLTIVVDVRDWDIVTTVTTTERYGMTDNATVPLVDDTDLDPTAEDGEPEAPDVRTDPVEDDPDADHAPAEE